MFDNISKQMELNREHRTRISREAQQHQLAEEAGLSKPLRIEVPLKPVIIGMIALLIILLVGSGAVKAQDIGLDAGERGGSDLQVAVTAIKLQEYDYAVSKLTAIIEAEPDNAVAYGFRSVAYFLMADYDAAMADSYAVLDINPEYASAYWMLGEIHFVQENFVGAEINFRRYLELAGDKAEPGVYRKLQICAEKNAAES